FLGFLGVSWVALGLLSAPGAPHLAREKRRSEPPKFDVGPPSVKAAPTWKLGLTEIGCLLGSLSLLFGGFVAVQLRYLFGGHNRVQTVAGLTYADYARGGFFELVWVVVLAVPLLLGCRKVAFGNGPLGRRLFLALGGLTILLLFVIIASAWTRMGLYVD